MRQTLLLLVTSLAITRVPAQITFHSLTEVWAAALKDNPTQQVYRLKTGQLTAEYRAAESYLYPQVGGAFTGQDNLKLTVTPVPGELINQPGKTLYLSFSKHYVYNAGINATENIFNWQSVLQSNIAHENIALNSLQQQAYEQNLKASSAGYYFSALIAAASLRVADQDLRLADSILATIRGRYTQGLVDLAAVHSAEINVNNVQLDRIQSSQLYQQAVQNLKILTGCTARQSLTLSEQLAIDSPSDDTAAAMPATTSPLPAATTPGATSLIPAAPNPGPNLFPGPDRNLDVYSANTRLAQLQTKLAKAASYPTLSLSGFVGSQQFRDDFGLTFGDKAWNDYRYLQLSLNVPIFTGFYTRNKYRSAQALARVNAEQYRAAVEQGKINDSLLITTYDNYRLLAAASGRNLLLYRENVELSRQKFEEGLVSVDTWQRTFEDYLHAENTHLNNLSLMYSAMSSIISRNPN
ncbi:MAG TPA: TolC family protein [Puia sp.]|nr:TolC family protein [Puia sp.]